MMTDKRFPEFERRGLERNPETGRVTTYCANARQYSKESDLERITAKRYYTEAAKKML